MSIGSNCEKMGKYLQQILVKEQMSVGKRQQQVNIWATYVSGQQKSQWQMSVIDKNGQQAANVQAANVSGQQAPFISGLKCQLAACYSGDRKMGSKMPIGSKCLCARQISGWPLSVGSKCQGLKMSGQQIRIIPLKLVMSVRSYYSNGTDLSDQFWGHNID